MDDKMLQNVSKGLTHLVFRNSDVIEELHSQCAEMNDDAMEKMNKRCK